MYATLLKFVLFFDFLLSSGYYPSMSCSIFSKLDFVPHFLLVWWFKLSLSVNYRPFLGEDMLKSVLARFALHSFNFLFTFNSLDLLQISFSAFKCAIVWSI